MDQQLPRPKNITGSRTSELDEIEGTEDGGKDEDDAENSEGEEDEYKVETICGHEWRRGVLLYNVQWDGYDESENTLEPEENLLPGAVDALTAYHKSIGGKPIKPNAGAKKRKSTASLKEVPSSPVSSATKRPKRSRSEEDDEIADYLPKTKIWDDDIDSIDLITRDENKNLVVFIRWKNGRQTKVNMNMVYKHCPVPMLKYYEQHLKFMA